VVDVGDDGDITDVRHRRERVRKRKFILDENKNRPS
jgi:hypothetical protein